jgi:hypothetical protein
VSLKINFTGLVELLKCWSACLPIKRVGPEFKPQDCPPKKSNFTKHFSQHHRQNGIFAGRGNASFLSSRLKGFCVCDLISYSF